MGSKTVGSKTSFSYVGKQTDVVQHFLECLRIENWDMLNLFLKDNSNVCSLYDDFFRKNVHTYHFCTPLITVKKQSKGEKAGTLLSWLVVKIEYSTCILYSL